MDKIDLDLIAGIKVDSKIIFKEYDVVIDNFIDEIGKSKSYINHTYYLSKLLSNYNFIIEKYIKHYIPEITKNKLNNAVIRFSIINFETKKKFDQRIIYYINNHNTIFK